MKQEKFEIMKMTDYCETCHCEGVRKHDCCNPVFRVEKNLDCHAHFRSLAMTGKKKAAFTLAETLITLTILGVVAAITVPMLINKQIGAANRTKLKKAMAVYEKALNQMIIDNDIKSSPISEIEGFRDEDGCSVSTVYFKKINGDGCRFQTADKVWWDISDIEHPLISLKDEITDGNIETLKGNADSLDDDKTSFVMVGTIKDNVVRIDDKGMSDLTTDEQNYLDKLYGFINKESALNKIDNTSTPQQKFYDKFLSGSYDYCKYTVEECSNITSNICKDCKIRVDYPSDNSYFSYRDTYFDENGNVVTINDHDKNNQSDFLSIYLTPGEPSSQINDSPVYNYSQLSTTYNENGTIKKQILTRKVKVGRKVQTLNLTYNFDESGNYISCSSSMPNDYNCENECNNTVYKCK